MRRLIAILAVLAVAGVYLVQCTPKNTFTYEDAEPNTWRVGLAFPSSAIELIDRSTVGRWSDIADHVKDELVAHGYSEEDILIRQSDKRADQVKQVDELVNEENVDELIVVPVEYTKDELIAVNGDPMPQYNKEQSEKTIAKITAENEKAIADAAAADPGSNASTPHLKEVPKPYEEPKEDEGYKKRLEEAKTKLEERTLESALDDAKKKGRYIVGMGDIDASGDLGTFPFDYEIDTPSPEDIANVQAGFIVAHLGLPAVPQSGDKRGVLDQTTDSYWPRNIEIMTGDAVRPNSKRYFAQLLERLRPYFKAGYIKSGSGLITADSTVDDYKGVSVTEDGDRAAGVMHDILDKYYKQNDDAHKISAIFASSDALSRGAVRAAVEAGWSHSSDRWPLITGYGAEKISVNDIVETKQAMSIAYDSQLLATGVAQILFNHALGHPQIGKGVEDLGNSSLMEAIGDTRVNGGTIYFENRLIGEYSLNLLAARPITITSDNLKEFMIDYGYVPSAEAGL